MSQLAGIYLKSRLVPVLGAGMSADRYVTWAAFVSNLEEAAGTRPAMSVGPALAERAHRALMALRRRGAALRPILAGALRGGATADSEVTPQTAALACLRWPLVLTTNYDDLYVRAAAEADQGREPQVLGRSIQDCQRMLTSLHEASEPVLWALHGYLGTIESSRGSSHLEQELVVGHDEYRDVTHTATHFRRTFSEVLRSRSLLFLGCGLDDPHLLGLLEETIALTGASPMPHYAVVFEEEKDASRRCWFLQARLSIQPILLPSFAALPGFLTALHRSVRAKRPRLAGWALDLESTQEQSSVAPALELVRGPLPESPTSGSCLAVSAGRGRRGSTGFRPTFSGRIAHQLARLGVPPGGQLPAMREASALRVDGHPIIVALARSGDENKPGRDARLISKTTESILDAARKAGFETVHAQLLATGRRCPFPRRVALAQMLRGFSRWRRRNPRGPRLKIHLIDQDILQELDAQRLDLMELLEPVTVRFWLEVDDGSGRCQRELRYEPLDLTLGQLAEATFTNKKSWTATIYPASTYTEEEFDVHASSKRTLEDLGVMPGATLRLAREPVANRRRESDV